MKGVFRTKGSLDDMAAGPGSLAIAPSEVTAFAQRAVPACALVMCGTRALAGGPLDLPSASSACWRAHAFFALGFIRSSIMA